MQKYKTVDITKVHTLTSVLTRARFLLLLRESSLLISGARLGVRFLTTPLDALVRRLALIVSFSKCAKRLRVCFLYRSTL